MKNIRLYENINDIEQFYQNIFSINSDMNNNYLKINFKKKDDLFEIYFDNNRLELNWKPDSFLNIINILYPPSNYQKPDPLSIQNFI